MQMPLWLYMLLLVGPSAVLVGLSAILSGFYSIPPAFQQMRSQEVADILGIQNRSSVVFASRSVIYPTVILLIV